LKRDAALAPRPRIYLVILALTPASAEQTLASYTNQNKRTLAEARVRCDAMANGDKVGTPELSVNGPIVSHAERTLDFMIPLGGRGFNHFETRGRSPRSRRSSRSRRRPSRPTTRRGSGPRTCSTRTRTRRGRRYGRVAGW
jgi:hypothetical protein